MILEIGKHCKGLDQHSQPALKLQKFTEMKLDQEESLYYLVKQK